MRLTEKDITGNWKLSGVDWSEIQPGARITKKVWEKLYGALWKLGNYEDTGLAPEALEALTGDMESLKNEMERLKEPQWISAAERSPEPGERVLLSFLDSDEILVGRCEKNVYGSVLYYLWSERVPCYALHELRAIAWMPAPKRYEGTR